MTGRRSPLVRNPIFDAPCPGRTGRPYPPVLEMRSARGEHGRSRRPSTNLSGLVWKPRSSSGQWSHIVHKHPEAVEVYGRPLPLNQAWPTPVSPNTYPAIADIRHNPAIGRGLSAVFLITAVYRDGPS